MRRRDFLITAACTALVGINSAQAGHLPPQFVNAYRPALDRLKKGYSEVTIKGVVKLSLPEDDKSCEQAFIYRADGVKRRLDVKTLAQHRMGLEVGATKMSMGTPYGSLNTETNSKSQVFNDAQQRKYADIVTEIDSKCLLTYPYGLDTTGTILEMLQGPHVRAINVKWIKSQGRAMVRVDYHEHGKHAGSSGQWQSSLILSPSDGWALYSFERNLQGPERVSQRGQLDYTSSPEGIPIVTSIDVETTRHNRVVRRESVSVDDVDFDQPDSYYYDSFSF